MYLYVPLIIIMMLDDGDTRGNYGRHKVFIIYFLMVIIYAWIYMDYVAILSHWRDEGCDFLCSIFYDNII